MVTYIQDEQTGVTFTLHSPSAEGMEDHLHNYTFNGNYEVVDGIDEFKQSQQALKPAIMPVTNEIGAPSWVLK